MALTQRQEQLTNIANRIELLYQADADGYESGSTTVELLQNLISAYTRGSNLNWMFEAVINDSDAIQEN